METLLVLVLVSITLSLPGNFLVLRNLSMTADAISHTTLLGIVLAFFIVHEVQDPLLIIFAAIVGVLTTLAIEALTQNTKIHEDASTGVVYSLFFAVAVILITKFAKNSHLSVDIVLMGEVMYTTLRRVTILGYSIPKSVVHMSILLAINSIFISLFYKELKVSSFDKTFAQVSGFGNKALYYTLMTIVSLSCVVAFDSVGAVLVLAFFVSPAACSYLISTNLEQMIRRSFVFAAIMSIAGYFIAISMNVNLAGMCAAIGGLMVMGCVLFGPKGMVVQAKNRRNIALQLDAKYLLHHIAHHVNKTDEERIRELRFTTIHAHMNWDRKRLEKAYKYLQKRGFVAESLDNTGCPILLKGTDEYEVI